MKDMENTGFLGNDFEEHFIKIASENEQLFELSREINKYSHEVYRKIISINDNQKDIAIVQFFIKSLTNYQSIYLLAKKGLSKECNIILRSLIELYFIINESCKQTNFINIVFAKAQKEKKNLTNTLSQYSSWYDTLGGKEKILEIYQDSKDRLDKLITDLGIEKKDFNKISIAELTKQATEQANSYQQFHIIYKLLCQDVHADPFSLTAYLKVKNEIEFEAINYKPLTDDVSKIFFAQMKVMIEILELISNYFIISDPENMLQGFKDQLVKAYDNLDNLIP